MGYSKTDEFLYKVFLNDYIDFYNKLPKISSLKSDSPILKNNKDYHHLSLITSKNSPALCHVEKFIHDIPLDRKYFSYYYNNPMFWMIPVETSTNKIIGFLLKGFLKKNYNWIHYSKISLLFGFYDFYDYKKNDPIIIVEGWRDCLYLKQFYKYVLALNTSSLNKGTLELLSCLTDKLIFILDNDFTGRKMTPENINMCKNHGIISISITPLLKDLGEYFTEDEKSRYRAKLIYDLKHAFNDFNMLYLIENKY